MGRDKARKPRPRVGSPEHSIKLPFERQAMTDSDPEPDEMVSAGVVTMAGAYTVPGGPTFPIIVFRFARPDGTGFYPRTVLVLEEADIDDIKTNWCAALDAARDAVPEAEVRYGDRD